MDTQKDKKDWGFDLNDLDTSVRPQDDFYQYANGGWLKNNPIPESEAMWGSFYTLRDNNLKDLHAILKEVAKDTDAPEGSNRQKLRDFYLEAMDEEKIEKAGISSIQEELKKIDDIQSTVDVVEVVAYLHQRGVNTFWAPSADQDEKDSSANIFHIEQGGIGLPDRDYYLKSDEKSETIKEQYRNYVNKMFGLVGNSDVEAKEASRVVFELETRLAQASMTNVERRDYEKQYNKFTTTEVFRDHPNVEFSKYFSAINMAENNMIVHQPAFLVEVNEIFRNVSVDELKTYLRFCILNYSAPFLSKPFVGIHFDFYGATLAGMKEMKPRWKRVLMAMNLLMGELLGEPYVAKHFPPEAKDQVNEMVDNIKTVFKERIENVGWLSTKTKNKALKKLELVGRKIGYPETWRSYAMLEVGRDAYVQNIFSAERFEFERMMSRLGNPVNKNEWFLPPQTVNAYCHYNNNEIIFFAGILQPPFFTLDADPAINYGATGSIIGHEFTHGFDDGGSTFDGEGNLVDWWTEDDRTEFKKRTKVIVDEFNSYLVLDDVHVNGELTQGENIADLGGGILGYYAYKKYMEKHGRPEDIDGFTPEQRFFLGMSKVEQENKRDEMRRQLINTDPHSPGVFRINGPLSNMQEFHDAFEVKEGDGMYRALEHRVEIW